MTAANHFPGALFWEVGFCAANSSIYSERREMSYEPNESHPEASEAFPLESSINPTALDDRKEVFRVLVQIQDLGETVEASRARVEAQFRIGHEALLDIEREGISMNWPPL